MHIGSYIIMLLSVESIHVVEFFENNDETLASLESWGAIFLISVFGNLWNRDVNWTLLSSPTLWHFKHHNISGI